MSRLVQFADHSPWYQDISNAPLSPWSDAYRENIVGQLGYGIPAFNAYQYNVPFYTVTADTPRVTLGWWDSRPGVSAPVEAFSGQKIFVNVPIPKELQPSVGSDAAVSIYEPATDTLWEFWRLRKHPTTGAWEATHGGRIDGCRKNIAQHRPGYGCSASGLALAAGCITIEEARTLNIDHAIYLALPEVKHWGTVSWPANRSDGSSRQGLAVAEGQRFRLDPEIDLRRYKLTPIGEAVARAAQKYGFIVCDKAGVVAIHCEDGGRDKVATGKNPWDELCPGGSWKVLQNFPWHRLQALPFDYGKP